MFNLELNQVGSLAGLSLILGTPARTLAYYVYKRSPGAQYKSFAVPKKGGGTRTIHAPSTNLKLIQADLAEQLSRLRTFGPAVNGYVSARGIKTNASAHVGKRYVLNIDLEDFFGSITSARVYGMLVAKPYELKQKVAAYIANACTLNGSLPQGAPSSPILSNLICGKLDSDLLKLAKVLRCTYTRYADDITFSSNSESIRQLVQAGMSDDGQRINTTLSDILTAVIAKNGFRPNLKKFRFAERGARQEATGLIVNEKVNVKRRYVRQVRAMLHAWRKFGYDAAQTEYLEKYKLGRAGASYVHVVAGKLGFIRQIKGGDDSSFISLARQFNALNSALPPEKQVKAIRTQLSEKERRERAVWVLEDHKTDNQGTAFFLEGVGLVTCAHCTSSSMYISHPLFPGKKYDVLVAKKQDHVDLATLVVIDGQPPEATTLQQGVLVGVKGADPVTLCGYPNHAGAFPMRVEAGQVLRPLVRSAVEFFEISSRIVSGNSGGPILDTRGKVIAVATHGASNGVLENDAQFFGVSLSMLAHL